MINPEIQNLVERADVSHLDAIQKSQEAQRVFEQRQTAYEAQLGDFAEAHGTLTLASQEFAHSYMVITPPIYTEEQRDFYDFGLSHAEYITPPVSLGELPNPNSYGHTHTYATMGVAYKVEKAVNVVETPKKRFLLPDTVKLIRVPEYVLGAFDGARLRVYTGIPGKELGVVIGDANLSPRSIQNHNEVELDDLVKFDKLFKAVKEVLLTRSSSQS